MNAFTCDKKSFCLSTIGILFIFPLAGAFFLQELLSRANVFVVDWEYDVNGFLKTQRRDAIFDFLSFAIVLKRRDVVCAQGDRLRFDRRPHPQISKRNRIHAFVLCVMGSHNA